MLKVENLEYWGFEHAIRGMRNPMNSWDKSDTWFDGDEMMYKLNGSTMTTSTPMLSIGENDLDLMCRLYKAGTEHRKYLRQIFVSMDITAPLYWWKEFDTYKIGTVSNSCSTMHKITAKEFDLDDFSTDHLSYMPIEVSNGCESFQDSALDHFQETINLLNAYRKLYLTMKHKAYWWQIIQLLPSSYNQKRTITMNYENVITIIKQRTGHKLDEWETLIDELKTLPYIKRIMKDGN